MSDITLVGAFLASKDVLAVNEGGMKTIREEKFYIVLNTTRITWVRMVIACQGGICGFTIMHHSNLRLPNKKQLVCQISTLRIFGLKAALLYFGGWNEFSCNLVIIVLNYVFSSFKFFVTCTLHFMLFAPSLINTVIFCAFPFKNTSLQWFHGVPFHKSRKR